MAPGLCFRGLFTLEHGIGYISSQSSATAVWLCLFQKAFVCLFLTIYLEVQNKLKKLLMQKKICSTKVTFEIRCFRFSIFFLYKKGPNLA